jgi:hypothetical protein
MARSRPGDDQNRGEKCSSPNVTAGGTNLVT